LINKGEMKVTF